MTNEQAVGAAKQLSEFCNKNSCGKCVFYSAGCLLTQKPCDWDLPIAFTESDALFAKGFLLQGYVGVYKRDGDDIIVYGEFGTEPLRFPKDSMFKSLPDDRDYSLGLIVKNFEKSNEY